jgi:hypothetical protein
LNDKVIIPANGVIFLKCNNNEIAMVGKSQTEYKNINIHQPTDSI